MSNVERIIRLEADADKLESNASELRWQAAELIATELATGKSQRDLARDIGKDEKHVRLMRKCWEQCGLKSASERPPFNEVYNSPEVRGTPTPQSSPSPASDYEPADVPPHDLERELAEYMKGNSGKAPPLFNYSPEDAIRDWTQTLSRIVRDMAGMAVDKDSLRKDLIAMIERIFDEA